LLLVNSGVSWDNFKSLAGPLTQHKYMAGPPAPAKDILQPEAAHYLLWILAKTE